MQKAKQNSYTWAGRGEEVKTKAINTVECILD